MPPPLSVIEAKRKKVLESATRMFLEVGYGDMTIDKLTEEVGGSKAYIFKNFGGKQELFEAVVKAACEDILKPLACDKVDEGDIEAGLSKIAKQFLEVSLSPKSIALQRVVIAERLRFPHLGELFLEVGPEQSYQRVADYLERQQEKGKLLEGDPHELAAEFLALVNGRFIQRMIVGGHPLPSRAILSRRITMAVKIFLHGMGNGLGK